MTIESNIIAWGLERPGWQQDVLVALADGEQYEPESISALADEVLAGTNDAATQKAKDVRLKSGLIERVSLTAVTGLKGVNALADGQELKFAGTGITVIYGDNGSGKSGYARLIKALVNARHRPTILPNVFQDSPDDPSGVLHYRVGETEHQLPFSAVATATPELLKMRFYDEHCGVEYLTKQSSISYRPSALVLLDGLIKVCDELRTELSARIKTNESQALDLGLPTTTAAGAFLASITASTTDGQIDAIASPIEGLSERLADVLQEEARLAATNPQKEKTRLASLARQVGDLGMDLDRLTKALTAERIAEVAELRTSAEAAREAASLAAAASFDDEPLGGVGSETWRLLWTAARNYSTVEAYRDHAFPFVGEGSACVLCHQSLDADAQARLRRFDEYMTDTTERDAIAAERRYETSVKGLQSMEFSTPTRTAALTALEGHDAQLGTTATALLARLEEQRDAAVQHLTATEAPPAALAQISVVGDLAQLASQLASRAADTDVTHFQAAVLDTKREIAQIQAHLRLIEAADKVKAEAERLRNLKKLKTARTAADTNSITQKASALTRDYATELILDEFTRQTERLRLQRVTLQDLGGKKGQLNQKPSLLGAAKNFSTDSVLSEGEQTALGLAGFFTEATFDDSKSTLIFDDPVTSLDHVRRDKVAERLAQLATERQIVVFTHDVAFTGDLAAAAEREGVPLAERAVERRGLTPGICIESFPWKAKDFGSRVSHLTTELAKLKKERNGLVQDTWEEKVATWAGYLSETWERSVTTEVMNQVFDRGSSQVRMMKFRLLAEITEEDNQDVQDGYGATSLWGRRHDKAAETNYVAPEPEDLDRELKRLTDWQKRVKKYLSK